MATSNDKHVMTTRERQERAEMAQIIAFLLFLLLAFGFAGTCDYHDEQAEYQRWEERGVVIQRW